MLRTREVLIMFVASFEKASNKETVNHVIHVNLRISPAPHRVSGPFGPSTLKESEKSPESPRVRLHGTPRVPKECAPGVSKESEKRLKPFRTLFGLRTAVFRDSGGPARELFRDSFRRGSGPEGPGRPCVGRSRS